MAHYIPTAKTENKVKSRVSKSTFTLKTQIPPMHPSCVRCEMWLYCNTSLPAFQVHIGSVYNANAHWDRFVISRASLGSPERMYMVTCAISPKAKGDLAEWI